MIRKHERWLVLAVCAVVGWFYVWTVRSSGESWDFGEEKRDYYNLLIDGYLDGQLHMKVNVPEGLLHLRNPYDPQERPPGLGLHDASFYKGKYYVYFGAAPMLVLMLPFRVLTGMDLPLPVAVLVFVYAGFLTSVYLWLAVRRRYFLETPTLSVLLGVLVLGLAGLCPVLLRRPDMWELPIAGAYFFAMLALAAVWRSLQAERSRSLWFGGAGLCLGLAIASRPTYLVAAPLLAPPLILWWLRERRPPWRDALCAVASLALIGGLMAWHNYARFEDPLQFGQAYQFSLDYESKLPHFGASYVPFTAKAHFLSAAQWSPYFPFIHRPELGVAPIGFTIHRGDVYGILINFPIAWLAFMSPLALWRRPSTERGPLGAWVASVALLFVPVTGMLLFFFSALARYQMDFAPALMLLACVGLLGVERWLQVGFSGLWRGFARAGWMLAAVFSAVFGIVFSLGFDGLLHEHNPRLEQRVAHSLNRIPAAFERLFGVEHGPVEMTVTMPKDLRPGRETLLTVGEPARLNRVFVQYLSDGRVQFGVVPAGRPERLSRPLSLATGSPHRVQVTLGALFPPATHPMFSHKPADEVRRANELISVSVNGEPVILHRHRIQHTGSGKLALGDAALVDSAYSRFRGEIIATRRIAGVPSGMPDGGSFVRLRLTLPKAISGNNEPLFSFGDAASGILLGVTRVGPEAIKFILSGSGANDVASDAIVNVAGRPNELVARVAAGSKAGRPALYLWLEGQLVWVREVEGSLPRIGTAVIGKNTTAAPTFAPEFRGEIFSVQQNSAGSDPLASGGDTVRVGLRLPTGRTGYSEPILVTGSTGRADLLVIEYVDAQTIRFGRDHWGSPMQIGKPVRIDYAQRHEMEITMPSLDSVEDATLKPETRSGRLRVTLNGAVVWEEAGDFFTAEPDELTFGRNSIGGTNCGPMFNGDLFEVTRVARE